MAKDKLVDCPMLTERRFNLGNTRYYAVSTQMAGA